MKILVLTLIMFFCSAIYGQKFKEPNITIMDCVKGLTDSDYFRARLIENGFSFSHRSLVQGTDSSYHESWVIYHQQDDILNGYKYTLMSATIQDRPDLLSTVIIGYNVPPINFPGYGEKLLSEAIKYFPHREVSYSQYEDRTIFFVTYSRSSDNIVVVYSFQNGGHNFEIYRED